MSLAVENTIALLNRGQADRLAILLVASLLSLVFPLDWNLVCAVLFLLLLITAARRASRSIRELAA